MDTLRAQHCFDQIESYLNEIREEAIKNPYDPVEIEELNDKVNELESELGEKEDRCDDLETEVDDLKAIITEAIALLQDGEPNIDEAIKKLESI
jgi:predicted RNase H-like nuclease (RuvC/YqgF family)